MDQANHPTTKSTVVKEVTNHNGSPQSAAYSEDVYELTFEIQFTSHRNMRSRSQKKEFRSNMPDDSQSIINMKEDKSRTTRTIPQDIASDGKSLQHEDERNKVSV